MPASVLASDNRFAGRDSRGRGCEKGFSHERCASSAPARARDVFFLQFRDSVVYFCTRSESSVMLIHTKQIGRAILAAGMPFSIQRDGRFDARMNNAALNRNPRKEADR